MLFVRRSGLPGSRACVVAAGVSADSRHARVPRRKRPSGSDSTSASTAATAAATSAAQDAAQQAQQAALNSQQSMARATRSDPGTAGRAERGARLAAGAPSSVPNGLNAGRSRSPDSGLKAPGVANPCPPGSAPARRRKPAAAGRPRSPSTRPRRRRRAEPADLQCRPGHPRSISTSRATPAGPRSPGSPPPACRAQILGAIWADGAVYLINQSGIIFGGTSQVNVHLR